MVWPPSFAAIVKPQPHPAGHVSAMNHLEFQLRGVGDPRLAVHASSALPAWLWSTDGTQVLWANPVGARLFGAANGATLSEKLFGPADPHRRQVAQLANRLPTNGAVRLERLRGFGAALGTLVTCGCARLDFADGSHGILIAAAEPVGRGMPLVERLQRLVEGIDTPIAAFARDGMFIGASEAARSLLGFHDLSEAGLGEARSQALKQGRIELPVGIGRLVLQRVGAGADIGLVALIATGASAAAAAPTIAPVAASAHLAHLAAAPAGITLVDEFAEPLAEPVEAAPVEPVAPPTPDYEAPELSGEAPAEFALIDEFKATPAEPSAETPPPAPEPAIDTQQDNPSLQNEPSHQDEPSPYVEAVADEPSSSSAAAEGAASAIDDAAATSTAPPSAKTPVSHEPPWHDDAPPAPRSAPLRFLWRMDADGRFSLGSDEFTRLIGSHTAAGFGRLWRDIAETFALDPDGRVLKAVASHDTWTGITLNWPVDGGGRLPVELSGLPLYDRAHNFAGYRGFGVCRDLDGLARLDALRRYELFNAPTPQALSAGAVSGNGPVEPPADPPIEVPADLPADVPIDVPVNPAGETDVPDAVAASSVASELSAPIAPETSPPTDLETQALKNHPETPKNVLPFRPISEPKSPVLTPVENNAFNELARQLAERLERENGAPDAPPPSDTSSETREAAVEQPAAAEPPEVVNEQPGWLARPEPPARGESRRDKALLDLLPVGVLIYRLDRLLYANAAFLQRMGYHSLHALEEAGVIVCVYFLE